MGDRLNRPFSDHKFCPILDNWPDQFGNVVRTILVVCIGVYNDVRAESDSFGQASHEGLGQSLVLGQAQYMVDATIASHLAGCIRTAVVNHQKLNYIDTGNLFRELGNRLG